MSEKAGRRRHAETPQLPLFASTDTTTSSETPVSHYVSVYRVALVRESSLQVHNAQLRQSHDAARLVRTHLVGVDREHFVVLLLNRKNTVIGIHTVSVGSLTASVVSPREVFKSAILANAAAIVCAHNHPSGAPRGAYV